MTDVFKDSTSHTYHWELVDSSTGLPKTGILYSDVTASYVRTRSARVAITPATLASASAAWSSGGFILVDDTNQPGVYRFDVPDAAFATGADEVIVTVKATGCRTQSRKFTLVNLNNQVAWAPNAAANANGGLPILSSSGTTLDYTISTLTAYTGNTPQTGDAYALIGATGSGLTSLIPPSAATISTQVASDLAAAHGAGSWATATGFSTHSAADVWSVATRVLTAGTNIALAKGTGVTGFTDLSAAQVTTAATAATPVVTISGTLTTLDATWAKIKSWLGLLAGKTADTVTRAELNATTAGATYNETTDSQEALRDNYTTGGDTLIVSPIVATQPTQIISNSGTTQAFRYTPLPSGPLVIVDSDGAAVDLSTSDLKMICRKVTDPTDTFTITLTAGELSVSGASHNYISVDYTPTVYGRYQRTTFRKPSGGSWAVIEIGHWQIEDGPDPA